MAPLLQANIDLNARSFQAGATTALARRLDWQDNSLPGRGSTDSASQESYAWAAEDLQLLQSCELIIAADVVYDDALTAAFLETTVRLMKHQSAQNQAHLGECTCAAHQRAWTLYHSFTFESVSGPSRPIRLVIAVKANMSAAQAVKASF